MEYNIGNMKYKLTVFVFR